MTGDAPTSDLPVGAVLLRQGRVRPILAGHPWIYAGAVAEVRGDPAAGDPVWVLSPREEPLGWGIFSPESSLRVRVWGFETSSAEARVGAILERRLEEAAGRRCNLSLPPPDTNAYRLVHGEGDRLPGLAVDVLGGGVSVRHGSAATWRRKTQIASALRRLVGAERVVHGIDPQMAGPEGLFGIEHVDGDPDADSCLVDFQELGIAYRSDLLQTQKTGHYVDQRENRRRLRALSAGRRVLDLCCASGGFALNAARGGAAEVVGVDSSGPAVAAATANAERNDLTGLRFVQDDMVRYCSAQPEASFDVVVLDPPKLVRSKSHLPQGLKKYRALNAAALRLVRPGGFLLSFTCSGRVARTDLLRAIGDAAASTGRTVHVHEDLGAGPDHPFLAQAPESRYLKGVLAAVETR